jgi:hypothetical protein
VLVYQENPIAARSLSLTIAGDNHCLPKRFTCPIENLTDCFVAIPLKRVVFN